MATMIGVNLDAIGETDSGGGGGGALTFSLPQAIGNKMRRGERWELLLRRVPDEVY